MTLSSSPQPVKIHTGKLGSSLRARTYHVEAARFSLSSRFRAKWPLSLLPYSCRAVSYTVQWRVVEGETGALGYRIALSFHPSCSQIPGDSIRAGRGGAWCLLVFGCIEFHLAETEGLFYLPADLCLMCCDSLLKGYLNFLPLAPSSHPLHADFLLALLLPVFPASIERVLLSVSWASQFWNIFQTWAQLLLS